MNEGVCIHKRCHAVELQLQRPDRPLVITQQHKALAVTSRNGNVAATNHTRRPRSRSVQGRKISLVPSGSPHCHKCTATAVPPS
jgi:hypothetical protein